MHLNAAQTGGGCTAKSLVKAGFMQLAGEEAAGCEQLEGGFDEPVEEVEAVFSPVERKTRLVAHDLVVEAVDHRARDVGRVAHQHVEGALDALRAVCLHDLNQLRKL